MFTTRAKIAIVSVINDLVTDHRVYKTCLTLKEAGYEVKLIGRKLPGSLPIPDKWPFKSVRMNLLFKTGPLFYLFFNLRLFLKLLVTKGDVLIANDLDTLLPNYLIARLKKLPLLYDSHEAFCEVPELQHTPFKKKIWEKLEAFVIPRLKNCLTVSNSIKLYYENKYKTHFDVVRNIPLSVSASHPATWPDDLPKDKKIIILQGAGININRGAEELIEAMKYTEGILLLIIGSGDVWPLLPKLIKQHQVEEKVRLISKIPKEKLVNYTCASHLGISIDKNTNLNYAWSLPNKIFDYIHANIPIVASRLPEIESIIQTYQIGSFIESHEPQLIASKINEALKTPEYTIWKQNLLKAQLDLNWEKEKEILLSALKRL